MPCSRVNLTFTYTVAPNVGCHSARNGRDSAVGTDISLRAGRSGVRFPGEARDVYFFRKFDTVSAAQPASQPVIQLLPVVLSLPGYSGWGREFDHSPQSSAEGFRMSGAVSLLPVHTFKVWTEFTFPFRHVRRIAKSDY